MGFSRLSGRRKFDGGEVGSLIDPEDVGHSLAIEPLSMFDQLLADCVRHLSVRLARRNVI
jgi:hypothetical protein